MAHPRAAAQFVADYLSAILRGMIKPVAIRMNEDNVASAELPPVTGENVGGKPRLHQSQLGMLYTCPLKYKYRFVDGIRSRSRVPLVTGTGTHASVEADLRHKIETGHLLDEEAIAEIAAQTVNRVWSEEGVDLDFDERKQGEKIVRGRTVDTAVTLAKKHHSELAPLIEPISVERTFVLELRGSPVDLAGTMDIEEATRVRDLKTYAKTPTQYSVDRSIQLSLYGLAKKTIDGRNPEELFLDVLIKKKEPEIKVFRTTRSDVDYRTLLMRVEAAVKLIESGCFNPTSPDSWACSSKYCEFWDDTCPYGRRAMVQVGF
jgi:hypothetical protein